MSYEFDSHFGEQLYQLLPEVYRNKDKQSERYKNTNSFPLARYLDANGHLLDLIHSTLQQQFADALPATSQDWLLPYFAKLLAANIVSPDSKGRHEEISHAIAWRQSKGTLKTIESIAEAVGQIEVEMQEGWKRLVTTARVDHPYRSVSSFDSALHDIVNPHMNAQAFTRHPGLGVATVDTRLPSHGVSSLPENAASKSSKFAGVTHTWKQLNVNGAPCYPNGFDDVSKRTVDIRSAEQGGMYHHKKLMAFTAPSSGMFALSPIRLTWEQRNQAAYKDLFKEEVIAGVHYLKNVSDRIVIFTNNVNLSPSSIYDIEGVDFESTLSADIGSYLILKNIQAEKVQVLTEDQVKPVIDAHQSLFFELSVGNGLVQLNSSSVLSKGYFSNVDIKDSIVEEIIGTNVSGIVQYSRIPELEDFSNKDLTVKDSTFQLPVAFKNQTKLEAKAVLAPGTSEELLFGASNGQQMGYFHWGRINRPVFIESDFTGGDALSLNSASARNYVFEDLIFPSAVSILSGSVKSKRCAFANLTVSSPHVFDAGKPEAVINAKDSLFNLLLVPNGLALLEYVTVMDTLSVQYLQASDCIFVGNMESIKLPTLADGAPAFRNCIRYSYVPEHFVDDIGTLPMGDPLRKVATALGLITQTGDVLLNTNTIAMPVFNHFHYCVAGHHSYRQPTFGEYGYGALAHSSPGAVRFGSEDGGEIGAYHHKRYSLKIAALLRKIEEFLPVGIEPIIIEDSRLLIRPARMANEN